MRERILRTFGEFRQNNNMAVALPYSFEPTCDLLSEEEESGSSGTEDKEDEEQGPEIHSGRYDSFQVQVFTTRSRN